MMEAGETEVLCFFSMFSPLLPVKVNRGSARFLNAESYVRRAGFHSIITYSLLFLYDFKFITPLFKDLSTPLGKVQTFLKPFHS